MKVENTFASHVENKTLSVDQIIVGLHTRVFDFKKLPTKVQAMVESEFDNYQKIKAKYSLD